MSDDDFGPVRPGSKKDSDDDDYGPPKPPASSKRGRDGDDDDFGPPRPAADSKEAGKPAEGLVDSQTSLLASC